MRIVSVGMIGAAAVLAGVAIGAGQAPASDAKGNFALHGVGSQKCQSITGQILGGNTSIRPLAMSWITGYMSATNRLKADTFDITPMMAPALLLDMVISTCAKNPNALFETATYSVLNELSKARVEKESPVVEAKNGNLAVALRKETLVAVQDALVKAKYLKGKADGEFGEGTIAALKAYQKAEKLQETGLPDTSTVLHLLVQDQSKKK